MHQPRAQVIAVSASARARGVHPGCSIAAALAMAPQIVLHARRPELEQATLEELAAWAGRYTPQLSIAAPDTVLLDIAASLRLFGGLQMLAGEIGSAVAALGLHVHHAVAPTPRAAQWLAQHRPGCLIDGTHGWQEVLDELPVDLLAGAGVSTAVLELLATLGIRSLGQARRLPRAGLARRQGAAVHALLAQACGEVADPRLSYQPPERHRGHLLLPHPSTRIEPLLFAVSRLFAALEGWLWAHQAVLEDCRLVLEHEHHPPTIVDIHSTTPTRAQTQLLVLAREHLATLTLPAAVVAMALESGPAQRAAQRSGDLFGPAGGKDGDAALLAGRLRARLGAERVGSLCLHADHRPERAWGITAAGRRGNCDSLPAAPRPLWLAQAPRQVGRATLTLLEGPERIESGWWDGAPVRRDYYLARDSRCALCWVFEDLDQPGQWYVHGLHG